MSDTKWSLRWIRLVSPNLYPVVDEYGFNSYYFPDSTLLWGDWVGPNKAAYGAAVNVLTANDAFEFRFEFFVKGSSSEITKIRMAKESNAVVEFSLKVCAESLDKTMKQIGGSIKFADMTVWNETTISLEIDLLDGCHLKNLASPSRAPDEPWAYVGKLSTELSFGNQLVVQALSTVEIYAICPALPKFLRYEGIPRTLLQLALSPLNAQVDDDRNVPFLEAITKRIFNTGFVYERHSGVYAFTSGAGRTFELNKYLQIWSVLNGTASDKVKALYEKRGFKENKPTVNCYDQAGILAICVSLACKDEYDRQTLIPYFMYPFGFLHPTTLVGFPNGQCNNPYSTWKYDLLVDPQSSNRTKFRNHVFLMFREKVYDACAGPVIGTSLTQYVEKNIDSEDGTYPTRFKKRDENNEVIVVSPTKKEFTGTWDKARPHQPSDTHGGILGEIGNMLHTGSWRQTPKDLDEALNDAKFELHVNITDLGSWLKKKTSNLAEKHKVTDVTEPDVVTGAGDIADSPNELGEVNWGLTINGNDGVIHLRIFPDFKAAAAERLAMFAHGTLSGGPSEQSLAKDQKVSGQIGGVNHATALIRRYLVDCESADLNQDQLLSLLEQVLLFGSSGPENIMKVGLKSANGVDSSGDEDLGRSHFIPVTIIKRHPHQQIRVVLGVSNCLDIDWSYTTGAVFLQGYGKGKWQEWEKGVTRDEGEEEMEDAYYFDFIPLRPGGDRVKLVFYDRFYNSIVRYLDFRIRRED